jgi:hypothetical protein
MLVGAHRLVTLAPGASYTATILHNPDTPFPAGVYRIALFYATEPPPQGTDGPPASAGAVTNAPFDVLAVPLAPSACPNPAAFALRERTV